MPFPLHLARYQTMACVLAIGCVAAAQVYFTSRQSAYLESVQQAEIRSSREAQRVAIARAEEVARRNLLSSQESAHVNMVRQLSQTAWNGALGPFLASARGVDARQAEAMRALPPFESLDTALRASLLHGAVLGLRLHDTRGITLYATQAAQVAQDQSTQPGWIGAARHGKVVSEQRTVDHRDVIVSHVPLHAPGTGSIVGVLDISADVTALVRHITAGTQALEAAADEQQLRATRQSRDTQSQVRHAARTQLVLVALLMAALCAATLVMARRAQARMAQLAHEGEAHQQRLVQLEKMTTLGQMVAGLAHQLNTPLNFSRRHLLAVIQTLDTLRPALETRTRRLAREPVGGFDAAPLDDAQPCPMASASRDVLAAQERLGEVLMGLNQMNGLVSHLRDFTRLDRAITAPAHLNNMLSGVAHIARSVVPAKVKVIEAFGELPLLDCNASQLNQAFLNLIVNAAQAIRHAGTVTISTHCSRDHICVSIADTGVGIPADILPRIFNPGFTTQPAGEGAGMGLTSARRIVTQHGGSIVVDSKVGQGSRFGIYLPLKRRP